MTVRDRAGATFVLAALASPVGVSGARVAAPVPGQRPWHPEPDFYTVGMKSYGRAPTFLLLTGYEQVRSVVAGIAGDWESARNVELVLPETGVCSTSGNSDEGSSCCTTAPTLISLDLGAPRELQFVQFAARATQLPVLVGQVNSAPAEVDALSMLIVAIGGLAVTLVGVKLLPAGSQESLNVRGAFLEVLSDLFGALGTIAAALVLLFTGWPWADVIASLFIGVLTLPRAWGLLKSVVEVLLEAAPAGMRVEGDPGRPVPGAWCSLGA